MDWFGVVKMISFYVVKMVWFGVIKKVWFGVVKVVWFGEVKMVWFGVVKMVWYCEVTLVWFGVVEIFWFGVVKLFFFGVVKLLSYTGLVWCILNGLVLMTWFDLLGIYRLACYTRYKVVQEHVWVSFLWNMFGLVFPEQFWFGFSGAGLVWFPWNYVIWFSQYCFGFPWNLFPVIGLFWFPWN